MTGALRRDGDAVPRASTTSALDVARCVLALATGRADAEATWPWEAIEALAVRECCGPLVWHRAGDAVRRHAPPAVVDSLRSHAVTTAWRLRRRLDVLRTVLETLSGAGVAALVHKGMPLSEALYGDPFVRPSADVDLFVGAADRGAARRALVGAGWEWVEGAEPFEEAFVRRDRAGAERVEVHTFALGDLLAHLPRPFIRTHAVVLEGVRLEVPSLASHAVTLSTHLSQHRQLPLLFAIDFATLWERLTPDDREEARARARASRVDAYLEFASRFGGLLEGSPDVQSGLLRDIGFGTERGDMGHPAWRDLRFARGADRARVAIGWLHPPRVRGAPGGPLRAQLRRLRRVVGQPKRASPGTAAASTSGPGSVVRTLRATSEDLVALVRETLDAAPAIWVDARGTSMTPTIPTGARVRLTRAGVEQVRRGAVVLADLGPAGGVVLHRVVARRGESLTLRGDNCARPDAPASIASVVAVADRLRVGSRDYPIPARAPTGRLLDGLRAVRAALARLGRPVA
jgi:Uncharacterised nucleotidyltransferase/Peptidase S24-like